MDCKGEYIVGWLSMAYTIVEKKAYLSQTIFILSINEAYTDTERPYTRMDAWTSQLYGYWLECNVMHFA